MKKKEKIIGSIVVIVLFLFFLIIGYVITKPKNYSTGDVFIDSSGMESPAPSKIQSSPDTSKAVKNITVEIKGEVINPGVYIIEAGSIVLDLVKKAGGYTAEADIDKIIQCTKLKDGDCLRVNKKGAVAANNQNASSQVAASASVITASDNNAGLKVDINSATKEELMKLDGIGETRAQKIIEYREKNGPFKSTEDLKKAGARIGTAVFENIRNKIEAN